MTMDDHADLQAQVIAMRLAVEGLWISLLNADVDPAGQAKRLGKANMAAIDQLDASNAQARAVRDAVARHTERLWGSIGWQLDEAAKAKR